MITKEGTVAPVSHSHLTKDSGGGESKQQPPPNINTCYVSLSLLTEDRRSLRGSRSTPMLVHLEAISSSLHSVSAESPRKEHYHPPRQFFQPPLKPCAHPLLSAREVPTV